MLARELRDALLFYMDKEILFKCKGLDYQIIRPDPRQWLLDFEGYGQPFPAEVDKNNCLVIELERVKHEIKQETQNVLNGNF